MKSETILEFSLLDHSKFMNVQISRIVLASLYRLITKLSTNAAFLSERNDKSLN